jgi:cytochrome P450 family 6
LLTDIHRFSLGEVAAQCFVFFIAGFETSSTAAQFALYELARNPDIQKKLQEEIDEVSRQHGGKITYEAVQGMELLDRVVAETLRMYPPVPVLTRQCTKTYTIPGTNAVIDEGVLAIIPVYAIQRDERYFPNPSKFDPDRFTEENKAKRDNYVYLPFGEGPRVCIGKLTK